MEGKTDNSQKKEEHDSLKPARDAIATAMRAAQLCGYRTDWEPHACPICHTLLEP